MVGNLTIMDIAGIISRYISMDIASIVETMEKGCKHLIFNQAVWNFALAQREIGRKTALVTANMEWLRSIKWDNCAKPLALLKLKSSPDCPIQKIVV